MNNRSNNNTKIEKEDVNITTKKEVSVVNESSDQLPSPPNNENQQAKESLQNNIKTFNPKKISPSEIVESNIFLRKCIIGKTNTVVTNPLVNSKFNNSMSYDFNLDSTLKSNAETHKNHSPPEIACNSLRENILNLKKKNDHFSKIVKANLSDSPDISLSKNEKTNSIENDTKSIIAIKKITDMDIILEEKEDKNKHKNPALLSPRDNNMLTIQPKIENMVIDFKKKGKVVESKTNQSKKYSSLTLVATAKVQTITKKLLTLRID